MLKINQRTIIEMHTYQELKLVRKMYVVDQCKTLVGKSDHILNNYNNLFEGVGSLPNSDKCFKRRGCS